MNSTTPLSTLPPDPAPAEVVAWDPAGFNESQEDHSAQTERAEAFKEPIREWNGVPLHGFSIGRESLWLDLRAAAGAPSFAGLLQDRQGGGLQPLVPDAIRILYILTRDQEEVKSARRDLLQFEQDAAAWAEQEIPRGRFIQAVTETLRIYNAAQVNEVELVTEGMGGATGGK